MAKERRTQTKEQRVVRLADGSWGVVSTVQLHLAGFNDGAIHRAVHKGWLTRLFRGAFAVGHDVCERGWLHAALISTGAQSVISHRSAAALHRLVEHFPWAVDVLIRGELRRRPRLHVHRTSTLRPDDITAVDGLRVTSVERTLRDLRRTTTPEAHARLVREARRLRKLDAPGETLALRSTLEVVFAELLEGSGLPVPFFNRPIGTRCVDVFWPQFRLIVEVDGWQDHGLPEAFENDRERDADHAALGLLTLRFTRTQLLTRPAWVLDRLRATIAARQNFARGEGTSHGG